MVSLFRKHPFAASADVFSVVGRNGGSPQGGVMDFIFWCVVVCFLAWRYHEWRIRYYHEEEMDATHMEMESLDGQGRKD